MLIKSLTEIYANYSKCYSKSNGKLMKLFRHMLVVLEEGIFNDKSKKVELIFSPEDVARKQCDRSWGVNCENYITSIMET